MHMKIKSRVTYKYLSCKQKLFFNIKEEYKTTTVCILEKLYGVTAALENENTKGDKKGLSYKDFGVLSLSSINKTDKKARVHKHKEE